MSERASQAGATAALALTPIRTRLGGARAGFETSVWTLVESDVPALLAEVERLRAALSGRAASEPVAQQVGCFWAIEFRDWMDHTRWRLAKKPRPFPNKEAAVKYASVFDRATWRVVPLGIIGAPDQVPAFDASGEPIQHQGPAIPGVGAPGDSEPPRNELEAMVMERRAAGVGAPEGQRIEGYAWRNGERGLGGEVWQFSRYHSLLPKPDPRATLIIHAEPVAPADGREGDGLD